MAIPLQSHLFSSVPPPSPIATGKGLKSAAVNDKILSEFLEKSLKVPDLLLPESYISARDSGRILPEIYLTSLVSGDEVSIRRLLTLASEFGAFQIMGHGIPVDDLRSAMEVADRMFGILVERRRDLSPNFCRRNDGSLEFFWFRSDKRATERVLQEIWPETFRTFSEKMENIFVELENVAKIVGQIISEYTKKEREETIQERESLLCLQKYRRDHLVDDPQEGRECSSHALSFRLFSEDADFHVHSPRGPFSFRTSIGAIVISTGKQLQEWSKGEYESVAVEATFERERESSIPPYCLDFMCSPSSLNHKHNQVTRTISLIDQMLVTIIITLLYNFLAYISSRFIRT